MSEGTLFRGATLLHLDPLKVEVADVRVRDGLIAEVGPNLSSSEGEQVVDVSGRWLMPGLVVGHHHLYSALAGGMPLPKSPPATFTEMLQEVWWRLDAALDEQSVIASAEVGGVLALKAGATTIVDHHASPNFIGGSLEAIDAALARVGQRRVLCYEVTDRNGKDGATEGLKAHRALLERGATAESAVMVGAHANFTLDDDTLRAAGALAREFDVGLHIHVAEAVDDEKAVGALIERMQREDALPPGSILAHCVHLSDAELEAVDAAGAWVTHQARSNMNNGVGRARPHKMGSRRALGTDGIGGDLFAELQAAYFRGVEDGVPWGPAEYVDLLAGSARLASEKLDATLGKFEVGANADLLVLDPVVGPPLTSENLAGAFVFRFSAAQVRSVYVAGQARLLDRELVGFDEGELFERSQRSAMALWQRMIDAGAGA